MLLPKKKRKKKIAAEEARIITHLMIREGFVHSGKSYDTARKSNDHAEMQTLQCAVKGLEETGIVRRSCEVETSPYAFQRTGKGQTGGRDKVTEDNHEKNISADVKLSSIRKI